MSEENYFSVKAAQNINAGDIITEMGGDVELADTLLAMGAPTNWFLGVAGFHQMFVMNGARGGRWPLHRYLNERKVGSFVNSSRTNSGTHNATGANAGIEWEYNADPRLCRAVLRARVPITRGTEILWDYLWV